MVDQELLIQSGEARALPPVAAGLLRPLAVTWRFVRKRPLAGVGLLTVIILTLSAVFAGAITPYGYNDSIGLRFESPSLKHPLGTDRIGRDQFSRIVDGGRVSMFIGLSSIVVGTAIAVVVGIVSGSTGGLTDLIIQRFVDAFMAFPPLVFLLIVVSAYGSSIRNVILVLGVLLGIGSSRIVRGAVLTVSNQEYVSAAQALGCGKLRIMWTYILPNVMPAVIVLMSVSIGFAILAEASLSFLGLGVQPPQPSWGNLLSTDIQYMVLHPGLVIWPGLALTAAVFGFNVLGDGLRDALDPRLRGR